MYMAGGWRHTKQTNDFPILAHFLKHCFMKAVGRGEQWNKPQNHHTQKTGKEHLLWLALGQIKQIKGNHWATPFRSPFSQLCQQPASSSASPPPSSAPVAQGAQDIAQILLLWVHPLWGEHPAFSVSHRYAFLGFTKMYEILNSIYIFLKT